MLKLIDAFCGIIGSDGVVLTGSIINDPLSIPTIVVHFSVDGLTYKAILHNPADIWEVFVYDGKNLKSYDMADKSSLFYEYSYRTVEKFQDKLFDWHDPERLRRILTDNLARDMMEGMDADIIRDSRVNDGSSPPESKSVFGISPVQKFVAKWTVATNEIQTGLSEQPTFSTLTDIVSNFKPPVEE